MLVFVGSVGGDGVRRSVGAMVFVGSVGAMGGKVERDVR
jgi:hypothetical protein